MIFDQIALHNFGVYGGLQEAILTPADEQKPIVLFGGLNGGGKTTLLDAIQLVLYGTKARCAGRGKLSYRDYLMEMIHRGSEATAGASIELRFRRYVEGEMHHYKVVRSWTPNSKGVDETLEVSCNAQMDPLLSEHWEEFIESYIPSGISHLFFFDAEQIKELAEGDNSAEILRNAVNTLLGLDLVDRLDNDLVTLAKRKRSTLPSNDSRSGVQDAQAEVDRLQKLFDEAKQTQGALGNDVGRTAKELSSCQARFRKEGGELFQQRHQWESKLGALQKDKDRIDADLREISAGALPLLLVSNSLEIAERQATSETQGKRALILSEALEERDDRILKALKRNKLSAGHLNHLAEVLTKDRLSYCDTKPSAIILDGDEHLAGNLRLLRTRTLQEVKSAVDKKLLQSAAIQEEITRCEQELSRVPREEAIANLQRDVSRLQKAHQLKQAEVSAHEDKLRVLAHQLNDTSRKLEKELFEVIGTEVDQEQTDRIIKHSGKVRDTLEKFRVAVIRKHAERLEHLILESFQYLLRKTGLVTRLSIDPSSFQIELTGGDGKRLPFDRLSAGERQLLATSILWGLAKASGRPLPMIIDTPLGRLDSSHRRNLIERYFPFASHQVILLSTDEEIDETNLKQLEPRIGRSYLLQFEEKAQRTVIKPGYFWKHEPPR